MYLDIAKQLLLYLCKEGEFRKNCVIKTLEIRFALLNRQEELDICVPTRCVIVGIGRSTIDIIYRVNTCYNLSFVIKTNVKWF